MGRNPLTRRSRRRPATGDLDVRAITLASGAGRIAIGVGLFFAPKAALGALGFREDSPSMVAVARIAGGRDIAMGAVTLAAAFDGQSLGRASLANAAVDAGDVLALSSALAATGEGSAGPRDAALRGIPGAVAASAASLWVAWRVGALPRPAGR